MPKVLAVRLSSLGDVILSSATLEAVRKRGERLDWLTLAEYATLFEGHPAIRKLWLFDKSAGLRGWLVLAKILYKEEYSSVLDLHRTLRTRLLKVSFWWFRLTQAKRRFPTWKTISKERFRLYGFFLLKSAWPSSLRPSPWIDRYSRIAGGEGQDRPDFSHLIARGEASTHVRGTLKELESHGKIKFICVMPGSRWSGKKWPVLEFRDFLNRLGFGVVVLGSPADTESDRLIDELQSLRGRGVPVISAIGQLDLVETAALLYRSVGYLGNDTGIAHLAESVGRPVFIPYGPTVPEMGFGPWRAQSAAVSARLWCSPCGKDGRFCFRPIRRHRCMHLLSASDVFKGRPQWLHGEWSPTQK